MKKLLIAIILGVSMVFTACDCGCDVEPVDLKNPEIEVYKMYGSSNSDYNKLTVYKYETPDAYIYRYMISGETKNIEVVPKDKKTQKPESELESTLNQETYFDY